MKNFSEFGLSIGEVLLPENVDVSTWSVIACDQYTQDLSYWNRVKDACKNKPSTLNLILPEVYLESSDKKERILKINSTMKEYLEQGVFGKAKPMAVYIERTTGYGRKRKGLICAVDLDSYEWKPFSTALIRATEATIPERIPPRKEIRKDAPLESPHIMLLVNDKEKCLVEKTGDFVKGKKPLYDGDLMLNSGHITGWACESDEELLVVENALKVLKEKNIQKDGSVFMFAVGDGNHSLATAKAVWDEYKSCHSPEENEKCPLKYALVEIVNIYDEGLTFEPIHRVLINADGDEVLLKMEEVLGGKKSVVSSSEELSEKVKNSCASFGFCYKKDGKVCYNLLECSFTQLAVTHLQPALDEYLKTKNGISIDYIHGEDEVFRLCQDEGKVTVLLPPVAKETFFDTIGEKGPLPRKSFSMGEASEKRFYLECRKLR